MQIDVVETNPYLFLGSRLKRLAEQMQTDVTRVSDRVGLAVQPGQFTILATLAENGPATVTGLAKLMRFSQPAVTQTIGKLKQAGLVAITQGDNDRRQRQVRLTAQGDTVVARARREIWPHVDAAVREAVDGLGGDFLGQLTKLEAAMAQRPLSARAQAIAERAAVSSRSKTRRWRRSRR